ncbi:kinase-like domain-containing protein [Mycotypha africana]|uniref:kinase-like domain-containing protein n=1 Tax=Mycotypha africana TaxID=64632 RepID=UPI002300E1BA|nr:kinase-like domain-containing protein [Mycotypha africana]KAI8966991.1 kinase-like domain-containing protein [Mycotypha africana]
MLDEVEIERIYSQKLHEELVNQTKLAVTHFIELCPEIFGLENLILQTDQFLSPINERVAQLYKDVCDTYLENGLQFDHAWDWILIWRQQLSFKALAEIYGQDQVVQAMHARARKAVNQIYLEKLDKYMQWFPWSWFSNMQFVGAGGFSAVYTVLMVPAYDPQPLRMALKIVDDKLLNEISVQSKAFLPLLFQGLTVCETTGDLMMVMKFSSDGNLEDHMQQLPLGDLDLKTITGTILRLAANLVDLHKVGMCHRNVHPRNIVCTDSDYFLVDYRFATPTKESSSVTAITKAVYGRLPYVAPEVRQGIYTEKSDIYSLGIIIWQLVSKVIFPSPDVLLDGDHKISSSSSHRKQKPAAATVVPAVSLGLNSDDTNSLSMTDPNASSNENDEHVYRIETVPGLPEWYHKLYTACLNPKPEYRPSAIDICQALQPIHNGLEFSVPLDRKVTEYIVARRAEVADHLRTYSKVKGIVSASTTRLYTLSNLPSTQHLINLPFEHAPFHSVWAVPDTASDTFTLSAYIDTTDPTLIL